MTEARSVHPPSDADSKGLSRAFRGITARRRKLEKKNDALRTKNARLAQEVTALRGRLEEIVELKRSYYLSGAGKKVDLRDIQGFSEIARRVMDEGRCGMHYDRLYVLWQAVRGASSDLPVVEVGAYKGGSARFISETLRHDGRSPRFYVCDTFVGHPRTDPEIDIVHHEAGKFEDTSVEAVAAYLEADRNIEIVVGDIVDTSARLAELSFGFVHIDVDLYEATDFCLRFFVPRLGGDAVMVIDDYGVITCPGVQKAVDDFVAETPQIRLFHLLSGQAILFSVP